MLDTQAYTSCGVRGEDCRQACLHTFRMGEVGKHDSSYLWLGFRTDIHIRHKQVELLSFDVVRSAANERSPGVIVYASPQCCDTFKGSLGLARRGTRIASFWAHVHASTRPAGFLFHDPNHHKVCCAKALVVLFNRAPVLTDLKSGRWLCVPQGDVVEAGVRALLRRARRVRGLLPRRSKQRPSRIAAASFRACTTPTFTNSRWEPWSAAPSSSESACTGETTRHVRPCSRPVCGSNLPWRVLCVCFNRWTSPCIRPLFEGV